MKKLLVVVLAILLCLGLFSACGNTETEQNGAVEEGSNTDIACPNEGDPLIVCTHNELEGSSVGQLIVQALVAHGYDIIDQTAGVASVYVLHDAMIADEVDIGMDYDGEGCSYFDVEYEPFFKYMEGWQLIHDYDLENNGILWLEPSLANNVGVIVCREDFAQENGLTDFQSFVDYYNAGGEVKLVAPEWWINGPYKFLLMEEQYQFTLDRSNVVLAEGTNEQMAAEGVDGINFAVTWANAATIEALDLHVLTDPTECTCRYGYCPTMRTEINEKYPEIAEILRPIFMELTDEDVVWLNYQVQIEGRNAGEVAKEYLQNKGYIE